MWSQIVKKCVPSLLLLIAGFFIAYHFFEKPAVTSLLIGWLAGGFLWGWSLTKRFFPNTRIGDGLWGGALTTMVVSFRITIAFAVGAFAMPIGIIVLIINTIAATAKVGKAVYDEAASKAESVKTSQENTQENTNTQ